VGGEIAKRLDTTPVPGSPNRICAEQLKECAVEYLRYYDDELARFPALNGQPHWNLWMRDARYEDALFVVLIFRAEQLEFFCGTGNGFQVRGFAESQIAADPNKVLAAMAARFSIPEGSSHFDCQAAEKWLGRGW
jgi:hypothetical protein